MMSSAKLGWRKLRAIKNSLELQQDQHDCGVAALVAVLKWHGCVVDKERLRRQAATSIMGTTMYGLYQAAELQGLVVRGVQMDMIELLKLKQPAILHVQTDSLQGHYMVYYGVDKNNKLVLFDPAKGLVRLTISSLEKLWKQQAALLFQASEKLVLTHVSDKDKRTLLYSFAEKDIPYFVIIIFIGIVLACLNLSTAIFSHKLIDDLIPSLAINRIHLLLALLAFLLIIHAGLNYVRNYFVLKQSKRFNERITSYFFQKLMGLPKTFFDQRKVGDMIARLTDTQRIQKNVNFMASSTFVDILAVLVSLVFLTIYSWPIALLIMAVMPIYLYIVTIFSKQVEEGQHLVMKTYSLTESNYIDCIKGMIVIIERNLEALFLKRTVGYFSRYQAKLLDLGMTGNKYSFCVEICNVVLTIVLIGMGAQFVINGTLSVGQLMAILTVSASLFPAFQRLAQLNLYFQEIKVSFDRMYTMVSQPTAHTLADHPETNRGMRTFEKIELDGVSFGFQTDRNLFSELYLELRLGVMLVLFGNSGHGKSTLLQLLLGHYTPKEGFIKVNGQLMDTISMVHYRSIVGSVSQETTIFNDTLYFNVTLNDQQDAANLAQFHAYWVENGFHTYFSRLGEGYATLLGEEGYALSGGQKQLIALSRALYSKPQLLLLDEPTAAMDEEMEQFVLSLLIKLKPTMGILFITHRQYIGKYADSCYYLRSGILKEMRQS